jgi:hypothetical protein
MIISSQLPPIGEFRVAPNFRRTAALAFAGSLLCLGTLWALYRYGLVERRQLARDLPMVGLLILTGLACGGWLLRQRLRVDDKGIWRRRFVHWDLWPWEAFASERIREGPDKVSFIFSDKPRYWRRLTLEFLTDEDRASVRKTIDQFWKRPPPPQIPEALEIKGGGLGIGGVRFSSAGICYASFFGGYGPVTSWTDLPFVELECSDHDNRNFRQLRIAIPGKRRPIKLYVHAGTRNWRGADPELIAAFLEKQVPPSRFWINALTGPPLDRAEYERRVADINKGFRADGRMIWLGFVELFLVLSWFYFCLLAKVGMDPSKWDVGTWLLASLVAILLFPLPFIIWFAYLENRKIRRKQLAELEGMAARRCDDCYRSGGF